ncbi:MAG: DUF1553 domain-containing protein [Verrucomicrobiota bacterium]
MIDGLKLSRSGLVLATLLGAMPATAATLEFNRDVRPILSENCFYCHGADESHREAKLRLDLRESAVLARDGIAAIVPGKPDESELMRRISATDPTDVMPPPESHKTLTKAQMAVLEQWIAEGASYQGHWAFETPKRPAMPAVAGAKGNAIDAFVRARLKSEGLQPSKEAAPETWLRRVSLDLVGLPPTPAELDRFAVDVAKRGEAAYVAAVERLMASAHFGERLAMDWLDAARYADTHGFNNDSARVMWRWRDWAIEAFNRNLPYDRFITEQLAGDLLPKPTVEQRIATAFNRNHVISSEGGIIDEEYRVEYVADRVRTTSTAWLGLTFECARCHDHKFDPITAKDYYRLFAFFNNVFEHGEDGRVANAVPMMPAPTREQQATLAKQEKEIAALDAKLQEARAKWTWRAEDKGKVEAAIKAARTAVNAETGGVMLFEAESKEPAPAPVNPKRAAKKAGPKETAPAPAAAVASASGAPASSKPAAAAVPASGAASTPTPTPKANVVAEKNTPAATTVASSATNPTPAMPAKIAAARIDMGNKDGVTVALWLRTENDNPRDVALFSSVEYKGSVAASGYGNGRELRLIDGEVELRISVKMPVYAMIVRSVGAKIQPGEWRHVALTYNAGRKAEGVRMFIDGAEVQTWARYDGANSDGGRRDYLVGTDGGKNAAKFAGKMEDARSYPRMLSEAALSALFQVRGLADGLASLTNPKTGDVVLAGRQQMWVREALLAEGELKETFSTRTQALATHFTLQRSLPSLMVMEEMPQPRQAYVLNRGQYDMHGEPVEAGVPEALLGAWPKGAPKNRLGLAQWLTSPQHPMTARVVVNRFWAQFFGTGIVKTLEDFGSQSEWPSHPELLDWLAREFVDGGWNVKALLKTIVLSSTYRQSSVVTQALQARDPENRLLARGPRVRLAAELIRDQALAVSGLLTPKVGGPSVFPYQPESLYTGVVVDAPYPGTKWLKSDDADMYRRSMYTFWKRTMPHPVMTTFDAPDREFCTVRRSRTNTPMQALTLWNEPGYVEAARRLGTRMLRDGPGDDAGRVAWAFQAATGRKPQPKEIAVLVTALEKLRADFAAKPEEADALLQVGNSAPDLSLASAELAAATSVASMILSLDETITKN